MNAILTYAGTGSFHVRKIVKVRHSLTGYSAPGARGGGIRQPVSSHILLGPSAVERTPFHLERAFGSNVRRRMIADVVAAHVKQSVRINSLRKPRVSLSGATTFDLTQRPSIRAKLWQKTWVVA